MTFSGKSKHWHADYYVQVTSKDSEASHIIIKYTGDKPMPKEIEYHVKAVSHGLGGTDYLTDGGILQSGESRCHGCATTSEDEKIKITIKWQGKTESFILESK
jgi:Uri superfamily endonuclease